MAQINLYYRTQLETNVSILPQQIDGNIDDHMLKNLRHKIEGKTNENGFVLKVNRLISYDDGMIDKANSMGTTVFPVTYECFICSPTIGLEIICVIENIITGYLVAKNGPIKCAIGYINIDHKKFEISDKNVVFKKTKEALKKGDYIKVSIINISFKNHYGKKYMHTVCKLLNLASKTEIQAYDDDQRLVDDNVQVNDDEFI